MKIDIKLNTDTIVAVDKLLKKVYEFPLMSQDTDTKIVLSIILEVADKFDRKVKSKIKSATLFDAKKLTKFGLKFHEVWALKEALTILRPALHNEYQTTLINKLINTLDQKLA